MFRAQVARGYAATLIAYRRSLWSHRLPTDSASQRETLRSVVVSNGLEAVRQTMIPAFVVRYRHT